MQESSKITDSLENQRNMDEDFISVECLEKLGIDENPFVDHARDPYLYIDEQLEMSINVLIDYLQHQNSTLVILGEIGIGKTTLLRLLLRKGYQDFNFCTLRAKNNLSFEEIEEKLRQRWSLGQTESADELSTDEYIKRFIDSEKRPVLVIDDAHRLDARNLDLLFQLKHRVGLQSSASLGLILSSEPSIQSLISELEQSNPAATHVYQTNVRTFDNSQCEKYINFRLEKAGCEETDFFDAETQREIYEKSLGLPRVINKLSRVEITKKCMRESVMHNSSSNSFAAPKMKLIGMLLLGLMGFAVLVFALSQNSNDPSSLDELEIVQADIEKPIVNKKVEKEVHLAEKKPPKEITEINKPYVAPLVLGKLKLDKTKKEDAESLAKDALVTKEKTTTKLEKEIDALSEDKEKSITQTKPAENAASQVNKNSESDRNAQLKSTKLQSPDWLLEQSEDAFTVQIVASPSESNLTDFNDKHFENQQTAYYKKQRDNKQWYVLVYGIYATREQAAAAIEALPEQIKKNKPYPLQLKFIQEVIRN